MNLSDQLIEKYQHNKLAHFYLLEPQLQESQGLCFTFIQQFLSLLTKKDWLNHGDIQVFHDTDKKHYLKEELSPIYNFLKHPALELQRKFIVINHAHKLSNLLINKLLKEFEEPPIPVTIFLINAQKVDMLPTLRSRASLIRLPVDMSRPVINSFPIETSDFEAFTQKFCSDFEEIDTLIKDLHYTLIEQNFSFKALDDFQKMVQTIEIDRSLNNPVQQVQFKLFDFAQKYLTKEH